MSAALDEWNTGRQVALDEIEDAHRSIGGTARGRRYATQQINQAYAVLLSSQFQGFCRGLHSECADFVVRIALPGGIQPALRALLVENRKLDKGNPNPGNIGSDFARFGLRFWDEVRNHDARTQSRLNRLQDLNDWRNAIAHQDFDPAVLGGITLRLQRVQDWRRACRGLAMSFDAVMAAFLDSIVGHRPW
jgi:hypothetical protein